MGLERKNIEGGEVLAGGRGDFFRILSVESFFGGDV